MVLLKTKSLESLRVYEDKNTNEIRDEFSTNNSIFDTLPQDSFQRFSWGELPSVKYATMNYDQDTEWKPLLDFIFGINGIQSEFLFLDAFCLDRPKKDFDPDKLFRALVKVYTGSSEHHIMESGSVMNGWTWHDLSLLKRDIRPTLHSSITDTSMNNMFIEEIENKGFDSTLIDISPIDKERVRISIISRWATIEAFNARVLDTIGGALKLSQVRVCNCWDISSYY